MAVFNLNRVNIHSIQVTIICNSCIYRRLRIAISFSEASAILFVVSVMDLFMSTFWFSICVLVNSSIASTSRYVSPVISLYDIAPLNPASCNYFIVSIDNRPNFSCSSCADFTIEFTLLNFKMFSECRDLTSTFEVQISHAVVRIFLTDYPPILDMRYVYRSRCL